MENKRSKHDPDNDKVSFETNTVSSGSEFPWWLVSIVMLIIFGPIAATFIFPFLI
ncbi:MAG: hypothetical protein PHQ23_10220 [Candidatus Wallbacteria bacterium]|nr:hypothetical protein [Candidatus Wallbacteria bacterium]